MNTNLETGTVISFNNATGKGGGYGFIRPDENLHHDLFVHISEIIGAREQGRAELHRGDRVSFEILPGKKGVEAKNVRVLVRAEDGDGHRPPLHRHD